MSHTSFGVNPHSVVCRNVKKLLAWSRRHIWSLSDSNWIWTHNHLVRKQTLNHLAKLAKWLSCVVSTYLYGAFDCMLLSCHVQVSEWIHTLKFAWMSRKLLAWSKCHIRRLSDSNGIRTHNHLVCKQTVNHLAKLVSLAKWLNGRLQTKWLWVRIPLLSHKEALAVVRYIWLTVNSYLFCAGYFNYYVFLASGLIWIKVVWP